MNAAALAQNAYARATAIAPNPRSTEYRAFATVTRRLSEHTDPSPERFADLAEALHKNQTLWIILASDVASDANALPDALRAQLFYLAEFTRHHTAQVLKGTATPAALVEINTAIMRGLRAGQEEV
ncbi:flagellar biosynthesis regulator FlaF [Oceanibium sediminis]|uniref:flagellar biosynthesis regulator FlaF n=1 Tax=Oceanibium sediminis TaxID=2026339 RepID=UPI000DD3D56A|nr:flagellar biosynthesis regulator FlaF [Oceanibium sediminis]